MNSKPSEVCPAAPPRTVPVSGSRTTTANGWRSLMPVTSSLKALRPAPMTRSASAARLGSVTTTGSAMPFPESVISSLPLPIERIKNKSFVSCWPTWQVRV